MCCFLGRVPPHALSSLWQSQPAPAPPVILRRPETTVPELRALPAVPKPRPAPTFQQKCILQGHTYWLFSVAFSPDGNWIVSGSGDNTILVWDWRSEKVILGPLLGHTSYVVSVAFSPDGQRIASGSEDTAVIVWDTKSGEKLHRLMGHTDDVRSIAFSPDGRMIISGSYDTTIVTWDSETGEAVHSLTLGAQITSVMFSPNGQYLAIATRSGIEVRDVQSWQRICGGYCVGWIIAVAPDNERVAYSDGYGIRIMQLMTGKPIMGPTKGHTGNVYSLAFSPDGTWIASGSYDGTIRIWDTATGNQISGLALGSTVFSIAISPSGMQLVAGCWDNTVRLYSCDSVS